MSYRVLNRIALSFISLSLIAGCGGGGGGSSDSGVISGSGENWQTAASITGDTCGERIADVRQTFTIDGSSHTINTSIITLATTSSEEGLTFGFSETNGDCQRNYQGNFSNFSGSTADVSFSSQTTCPTITCESTWAGTATRSN